MIHAVLVLTVLALLTLSQAFAQTTNAPAPPPQPLPPGTIIERQSVESYSFQSAACRSRPNGYYCGHGTNRQLLYQCVDGAIANELNCPGGCDEHPVALTCKQEFGVKGIDPPKPQ